MVKLTPPTHTPPCLSLLWNNSAQVTVHHNVISNVACFPRRQLCAPARCWAVCPWWFAYMAFTGPFIECCVLMVARGGGSSLHCKVLLQSGVAQAGWYLRSCVPDCISQGFPGKQNQWGGRGEGGVIFKTWHVTGEAGRCETCKVSWRLKLPGSRIVFLRGRSVFFLPRPSTYWMRPTHIMEGYLLYSGLPCDSDSTESACNAGDPGSLPGSGRSHGGGNGNPLQCSFLVNSKDRASRGRLQSMGLQRIG